MPVRESGVTKSRRTFILTEQMMGKGAVTPTLSTDPRMGFYKTRLLAHFSLTSDYYSRTPRTSMSEENDAYDKYDKITRETQITFSDARAKRVATLVVGLTAAIALGAAAKNEVLPGQRRNPLHMNSTMASVTSGASGTAFSQAPVPLCTVSNNFRVLRSLGILVHLCILASQCAGS